jgi:ribosomal-protein-alanine N-acetyltransferase
VSPPSDHEGYAAYLRRLRRNDAAGFLVRRTEDDALAGAITLSQIVLDPLRSAYCGYYAFAPLQGQGLMTEAMELTVRHAFRTLRLHRIEANVQPGNVASIALVRRCGFRLEGFSPRYLKVAGRWRDHERWAITVEDQRRA